MSVTRIASRYAKSLIDLAQEQKKLERVKEDVDAFVQLIKVRDFYLFIKSPIVSADKKKNVFHKLFDGKFDVMTTAFLDILVRKGREAYLPEIAKEFMVQYKIIKHISTVKLTTAVPVGAELVELIRKRLEDSAITDEHVEIMTEVDPDIKGGYKLEIDDKLIDASLSYKVERLRSEFEKNLYVSQIIAH
ncbi:MAG: ATP synthase F1 subunit delta [Phaeodactylibacter sp.]|nr:ATP synthase F1 subunit delta [Phaeodactylibacter sp.]